ncbi:MAG: hypothetical protein ACTSRS_21320 [Candidatus Helarchaeota archaeon]
MRYELEKDEAITKLPHNLEKKLESLTHYLEDPECPRTNNVLEHIWSHIRS